MAKAWVEDLWHKRTGEPSERCRQHDSRNQYKSKVHGKGARWQVRGLDDQGGRLPKENYESYDDAQDRAEKLSGKVKSGEYRQELLGQITLERYFWDVFWPTHPLPPGQKEKFEQRTTSCILCFPIGELPLADIGPEQLNMWTTQLRGRVEQGLVRTAWQTLSKILQAAFEAKRITQNPCRGLRSARPPRRPETERHVWGRERIHAVRQALPDRYQITEDVGLGAALRQGECFGISPDDFSGDGHLNVVRQLQNLGGRRWFKLPKNDKKRRLPIAEELEYAVDAYCKRFPPVEVTLPWVDNTDPLMPWEERPLITVRLLVTTTQRNALIHNYYNPEIWKPALEEAGVLKRLYKADGTPRKSWHDPEGGNTYHVLRDTWASQQLAAFEAPANVAKWMGDTVETIYRYYAKFIPDDGGRGLKAMSELLMPPE
ncbi:hypothetical protein ACMATS_06465 [Streptoverticillium reticulum]|uniref:hypothetical protein n=1 Tax=Streptoverticillium reticulum TaxID=1433415 RepID=UPI0039BF068C